MVEVDLVREAARLKFDKHKAIIIFKPVTPSDSDT